MLELLAINYFHRKTPSYIFESVVITLLSFFFKLVENSHITKEKKLFQVTKKKYKKTSINIIYVFALSVASLFNYIEKVFHCRGVFRTLSGIYDGMFCKNS